MFYKLTISTQELHALELYIIICTKLIYIAMYYVCSYVLAHGLNGMLHDVCSLIERKGKGKGNRGMRSGTLEGVFEYLYSPWASPHPACASVA